MAAEFDFRECDDRAASTVGPFTVTPYRVDHPVEAYGMRVEADGAVLAYTGDTDACDGARRRCAADADLVLPTAAFVDGRDDADGHPPHRAAGAAQAAAAPGECGRLVLTHMPPWNDPRGLPGARPRAVWPGEVELAAPGATYEL